MSLPSVAENAPESTGAEKTNQLLERNNALLEKTVRLLENIKHSLEGLNTKATNAEMRQCQVSGEGTDASRMTSLYLTAESAVWSQQHRKLIFEKLYEAGDINAIVYSGIFHEKDKRRTENTVAYFYATFVESRDNLVKALKPDGAEGNTLGIYMPTFRKELDEMAKKADRSGPAGQHGKYETRMNFVLGEMPEELKALQDLCLPLDKKYRPVQPEDSDMVDVTPAETFKKLSNKILGWIEYASSIFAYGHECDVRTKVTKAIVDWTYYTEDLKQKLQAGSQKTYENKCQTWLKQSDKEHEKEQDRIQMTSRWAAQNLTSHCQILSEIATAEGASE